MKILFTAVLTLMAAFLIYFSMIQPELSKINRKKIHNPNMVYTVILFTFGLAVRYIFAATVHGHETDMGCFSGWADMLFNNGISSFYASDGFTDYPPGYMYILYIIGALKSLFSSQTAVDMLIKSPAIICDVLLGVTVYKTARRYCNENIALAAGGLLMFNPALIINSSMWGQVDSVFTLFVVLMVCLVTERKMTAAYFVFALSIFIKPQALIFTPVLIYGIIDNVFLPKFDKKLFVKNLLFGLCAIAMIFILALPFGVGNVVSQYVSTLGSYPYATVNAFNIWGAFGQNWTAVNMFTKVMGYVFIAAIVAVTTVIYFKSKNTSKYFLIAAVLSFGTYMLSSQMHERYAYPAVIMLLMTFVMLPNIKLFIGYVLISVSQIINTSWVLFEYSKNPNKYYNSAAVNVFSFVNIAIMIYLVYIIRKMYIKNETGINSLADQIRNTANNTETRKDKKVFEHTKVLPKLKKIDFVLMIAITAVYACVALYDLGDMTAPQSFYEMTKDEVIALDLGKTVNVKNLKYFLGVYESREFSLVAAEDVQSLGNAEEMTMDSVFAWGEKEINKPVRYICLKCDSDNAMINELAVTDTDGNTILPVNADKYDGLFDEQDIVPERMNFRNSTYFDEIYHARTAYEFIHGLTPYEWTHPPLGKIFISVGVLIFGMVPFGWRIAGTVFGIAMVPVIYCFAKKMLKHTWLSVITCLLFTFDFMHFTQTRIATIDVYVTFFIMLMYYYMYKYYSMSFYDTKFSKTLIPLGLSGVFMGFGIASKWTGVYAGAGLAVLFFITLCKRYNEYRYASENPNGETDGIQHKFVTEHFKEYTVKTIIFCIGFFVIVPICIYCLSYIPYLRAEGMEGFKSIWDNQVSMLTYHGKTVVDSTHAYSSRWYEWPIIKRPIWYFSGEISSTVKEGISAFGNPAVWWMSIAASVYMLYTAVRRKNKTALFLVIAYLAQLVSWIPVTRITFIYHYFPSVPFLVLMLGYSILLMYRENERVKYFAAVYAAVAIGLFVMFYPVLSGQPVDIGYVKTYLKWFDTWVLVSGIK